MALRFPYRAVPTPRPCLTLGGQRFRLRPIVELTAIGPVGSKVFPALLDTGADEIVLPETDAANLGIDLSQSPANTLRGVGSAPQLVRYAPIRLRLTDGVEFRDWSATVGFSPALVNRALFGMAGGLQYFTTTFHGDLSEVELSINASYPGT